MKRTEAAVRVLDHNELATTCGGAKWFNVGNGIEIPRGTQFRVGEDLFKVTKKGNIKALD